MCYYLLHLYTTYCILYYLLHFILLITCTTYCMLYTTYCKLYTTYCMYYNLLHVIQLITCTTTYYMYHCLLLQYVIQLITFATTYYIYHYSPSKRLKGKLFDPCNSWSGLHPCLYLLIYYTIILHSNTKGIK